MVVKVKHLQWLGLRSLKEVSAGRVRLKENLELCYTDTVQWAHLFRSRDQTIKDDPLPNICGESRAFVGFTAALR